MNFYLLFGLSITAGIVIGLIVFYAAFRKLKPCACSCSCHDKQAACNEDTHH